MSFISDPASPPTGTSLPGSLIGSGFSLFYKKLTENGIHELIDNGKKEIEEPGSSTGWMDLVRMLRQPQILWEVDFIKPGKVLKYVNQIIKESEIKLYGNHRTLKLKDGYTANIYQEISFHTIRAHMRAEEGDIQTSLDMFVELLDEWYDEIIPIRQSNLLMHCCLAFLCNKQFEESYECFNKHWTLLKCSKESERTGKGFWDNQVIMQMIYWFFMKHVQDFRDFYTVKTELKYASELFCHKKIPLLNFLGVDDSWVASFCSLPYYNHARTIMPALPEYELKENTHRNHEIPIILDNTQGGIDSVDPFTENEKFYHHQYNLEARQLDYVIDSDLVDNLLFSFYSLKHDYDIDNKNKQKLLDFLNEKFGKEYSSLLECGCGKHPLELDASIKHTRIDISEQIYGELKLKNKPCIQQSMMNYLYNTCETFDVCFCCDILQILTQHNCKMFLQSCKNKCECLVAMIDTREDIRKDIVIKGSSVIQEAVVHRNVMKHEEWKNFISEHYTNVEYKVSGPWVYILAS